MTEISFHENVDRTAALETDRQEAFALVQRV